MRAMMTSVALSAVLVMLLIPAAAQDAAGPRALSLTWNPLWSADETIRVPIEATPARHELQLPAAARQEGALTCLRFKARLHNPRPAGWNNYLGIVINDNALEARDPEGWPRTLNRRMLFATTHPNYPQVELVQPRNGLPCLQVFFGPEEPVNDGIVLTDVEEGYWYLVNVTDLLKTGGANTLGLVNTALTEYWGGNPPEGMELLIEDLALGTVSQADAEKLREGTYSLRERLDGPALELPQGAVRATPGGGLQVELGDESYFIESAFSYVAEPKMGLNRLQCLPETEGEPGWTPRIEGEALRLSLTGTAGDYRLDRNVTWEDHRVAVVDTISNLTDGVLGLAVEHNVITPQPPRQVMLNGIEGSAHGAGRFPENPTVFVRQGQSGIGVLAEDNAMRLQMGTRAIANETNLRTDKLGLKPGETYELRWAIYPTAGDYFDFINAVRRDWDVNYTITGPWDFFDVRKLETEEGRQATRRLLERKHQKIFALTPWFEYYNGWGYTRDEFRKLMVDAMDFIRGIVPDAVFQACVETNLVPVPLTFFGDALPKEGWPIGRDNGGKYGQAATPQMTALIDASPWKDSCLRDAEGNVLLDCWYVQHYSDPPALNLMTYPEIGNHRHEHMMEQLEWLLDDVGFDGVYIDQFSMAYNVSSDRYTRERWDGRTVELDASGRVSAQIGDLGLISAEARAEWVKFALDRGKVVVANSQPAVNELQRLRDFRFMETQGYDPLVAGGPPYQWHLVKGQLHSPLGLGHSFGSNGADFFVRTLVAHLRFGLLYYCYFVDFPADGPRGGEFGPLNNMFPFTPVELHEGWVLGEERLITCVSGQFHWPGEGKPRVVQFDERGREKPAQAQIAQAENGWSVEIDLRDWWEIAVVLP